MQGWIKLHRKIIKWEWYQDSHMVHLLMHLLLIANHEPGRWRGVNIDRGQVVTGLGSLSKATGITIQTLRTCLARMKKSGELTSKSTNRFRLITLCNYESYQISENGTNRPSNKQLTSNQQATNKQLTANKNDKNKKNEKKTEDVFSGRLDTPSFHKAWSDWVAYRKEKRCALTPTTISRQIKLLEKHPPEMAIAIIEKSISNGWQGLFPDKVEQPKKDPFAFQDYRNK